VSKIEKTSDSLDKLQVLRGFAAEFVELERADTLPIIGYLQVHHAADLIVKAVERNLAGHGLSVARYAILRMLSGREPMPLTWIAERHFSRPSNITAMVDRLARDGMVERLPDAIDRRVVRVALTPAGAHRIAEARKPHRDFLATIMSPLDESELRTLVLLLGKLSAPHEGGRLGDGDRT
jgi:DNA-binding MarR family transcriptional regulator